MLNKMTLVRKHFDSIKGYASKFTLDRLYFININLLRAPIVLYKDVRARSVYLYLKKANLVLYKKYLNNL